MQSENSSKREFLVFLIATIFCLLLAAGAAFAQGTTGSIDITVTDNSGSAVPEAAVTAINAGTGAISHAQSSDLGRCLFPLLRAGTYTVTVERAGFETLKRENVIVNSTETVHLDLRLQVGAITESVTVNALTPLLQTQEATQGHTIEGQQITATPLATRNFTQLLGLAAGVTGTIFNADNPGTGGMNVSVDGGREGSNILMVDGTPADNQLNLAPDGDGTPSLDFLGEFKILEHDYSAEFGRSLGSVVNVTTKSGSNETHGEAYEFLRNTDLDARPFFSPANGENVQNQFGANMGGHIFRNKTFYFVGYEGSRQRNGNSGSSVMTAVVPTLSMRQGIFPTTINDPTTGAPFPNNTIPQSRQAVAAVDLQNAFIPQPNYNSGGATNFFASQSVPTDINEYTFRIDHRFNDKNLLWGRFFDSYEHDLAPFGAGLPGFGDWTHRNKHVLTVDETHVFSPSLVMETVLGYNQTDQYLAFTNKSNMSSYGLDPLSSTLVTDGLPQFTISNYVTFGNYQHWIDHVNTIQLRSDLTWTHGKHTLKFGGSINPNLYNDFNTLSSRGLFSFTGNGTGNAYADWLGGFVASKTFGGGPGDIMNRDWAGAFYASEQWRVTNTVTITAGVRWEPYWQPAAFNFNRTNFWPQLYNPPAGSYLCTTLQNCGIVQGGVNGVPPATVYNNMKSIMPRLGIAWRATNDWVVRTGVGQFFDQRTGQIAQQAFANPPGYTSVSQTCSANIGCSYQTPDNFTFVNPNYNPSLIPVPTSVGQGLNYAAIESKVKVDNAWQWNFSIQRQLPSDTLIEAAYVGTRGLHLMGNYVLNQEIPVGFNPANPQPGTLDLRFPGFGTNSITGQGASSWYNALQVTVKRRVGKGTIQAAYTWSKSTSNGGDSSTRYYVSMYGSGPWWDWHRLWGPDDIDRPQRVSIMFSQDLPKHFTSGPGKIILNNWAFSGLLIMQSGGPLTVTNASSGQGLGGGPTSYTAALYSNVISGVALVNPGAPDTKVTNYIDKAAWSKAPAGTVGNAARGMFLGPGQANLDFSIFRYFPIREKKRLEFRTEFFNITNHPDFGNPSTSMDSASFGQISSTTVNARIIQFALKMVF